MNTSPHLALLLAHDRIDQLTTEATQSRLRAQARRPATPVRARLGAALIALGERITPAPTPTLAPAVDQC